MLRTAPVVGMSARRMSSPTPPHPPSCLYKQVRRSADNAMGWADDELTKQSRDLKEVFDFRSDHPETCPLDGRNRWPAGQPEFRAALQAYFREMTRCAFKLTEAFCIGLGMPPTALHGLFEGGVGFARLNFYDAVGGGAEGGGGGTGTGPAAPPPLGIHRHTDAGFLTILLQDEVPGLQVLHQGEWQSVRPIPGALTINVGDMCQVLSNDEFLAPVHRVLAPTAARRYSVPFFFNVRCVEREQNKMRRLINSSSAH